MDFALSDEQRMLYDQISRFASTELNRDEADSSSEHEFPMQRWAKCGDMLLQGLPVPEEQGGAGLDPVSTAIANPQIAPMIIMPSTPRFRTPERSATISPIAARRMGVDDTISVASRKSI